MTLTIAFVDTLFLKQKLGPTLNLTIAVSAIEGHHSNINHKDKLETDTITIDDSVEAFFKFKVITINKFACLDTYICLRKKETKDNSAVRITMTFNCKEQKTCYVQCTNTQLEISLGKMKFTSKKSVGNANGSALWMLLYKLEITLTIKELSMKNKLYEDTEFTDFQLQASDGSVAVHKAILSVHSDMFKTMLRGEWKETTEGCITMDGVTVDTLQHLKDYMYLETLPDEGLEPLLLLAEHYLMDKLKADCIAKLVTSVTPENFEGTLQFACQGSVLADLVKALILQVPGDVINAVQK